MRLLQLQSDDDFSLIERIGNDIPPYAILSHTWGADEEEVTFKDLVEGTGKRKAGYRKLAFCGRQAKTDGLQYFWVDTCCIDKSSSAELSEAINSMFRWYYSAAKCYVYLSDVSTSGSARDQKSLKKICKWFTRGWTLQELLAPRVVEFFSAGGVKLGEKRGMTQMIREITGIDICVLQGKSLHHISVEDRMSWAEKRQTKREEDAAYSLLGIFNVHMPLIYGEGKDKAFVRLKKEIQELLDRETHATAFEYQKRGHGHNGTARIERRNIICHKCGYY
ncbi:HET and Ankyrin domain-containing protein [Paraphaeosphaeria sporulosa]